MPRHPAWSLVSRRWPAAAAVAASAALSLAGCGGGQAAATSPQSPAAGRPVPGNTLTVAIPAAPTSLNPGTIDNSAIDYTLLAYDPLIEQAPNGSLTPALAVSWGYVGSGNKVFGLQLRSGVVFSDGDKLTAAGVRQSLLYAKSANGPQASLLAGVTGITVTGPLSLRITMAEPDPFMAQTLTQTYGVGQIMSPAGIADAAQLGISTVTHGAGPYVLDPQASVAGDEYTYVARTNYYDPSRVHFKKIILKIIANPQAVIDALKTGQVDATIDADYTTVKQAIGAGLQVKYEPFVWQGLNLIDRGGAVSKPLGSVLVRQAINYAINRPEIASALLGSYGLPTDEITVPGADGYSSAMSHYYAYDPAKAKQLLAQAGYPHGFTLPVLAVQYDGLNTTAEAIAGELAAVGIKVQLIDPTDPVTYEMGMVNQKYPAIAVAYGAQPMYLAGQELFLPQAPVFNGFHTQSPALSSLYGQAAASAPAQRAALDVQMNDYLMQQAWFAPVVFTPVFVFARASLGGVAETAGSPVANPLDWYNT